MRELIIVMGDLAAGKSTFAALLARKYNIPLFMKDTYKEALSDVFTNEDIKTNTKLSHATFLMLKSITRDVMESGASFILESNFKKAELEALSDLVAKYKYNVRTLWLQGDIDVLHKRYVKRFSAGRHKTHTLNDLRKYEDFKRYALNARNVEALGEVTLIDATSFDYQTFDWDIKV